MWEVVSRWLRWIEKTRKVDLGDALEAEISGDARTRLPAGMAASCGVKAR